MFSRSPEEKKVSWFFFKLTRWYVNQTQADDFTCTIVPISIVPWFAGAIEWSLGVIAPSVFMTAIICSVKPSKFKGAGTRTDKHKRCKSALSVVLEEFYKVVVWLLKQYTRTANVTINTFLFWKCCQVALHQLERNRIYLSLASNMIRGVKQIIPVELYCYTSRSRLHNIVALLGLCAFYFTYFFTTKITQN